MPFNQEEAMLHLLTLLLAPAPATLPEPPALVRMDHDDDHGHDRAVTRTMTTG